MPTFEYIAVDKMGKEASGAVEALCGREAVSKIRNRGLFPTRVQPQRAAKKVKMDAETMPRKRRGVGGKVKIKAVTEFARQFSTLQDAGLAILRSLRILERQQKKGAFKRIIGCIADDIESGETLSEAMGKYPKCFTRLFVNMVAAGEVGGVLDVVLNRTADFMEKSQRIRSKVKGAMIYPAVVLTIAFVIVLGLMTFVIPTFSDVLKDLGGGDTELPALTLALMEMGDWLKGHYGLNAVAVFLSPILLVLVIRLAGRFQRGCFAIDWIKLHLPVMCKLVYKTAVARWTRTLATLIEAGVPILDALAIARQTAGNEVYAAVLDGSIRQIRQGGTFAHSLQQSTAVDELVVNMIEVGEETGDLDKMLLKVADSFDEQTDVLVSSMMSVLEPVMIIVLGLIVGTIVLAIFLPIIDIITHLGQP